MTATPTDPARLRSRRLLLVEDDEEDRFVIERMLGRNSGFCYKLDCVNDPRDVKGAMQEKQYDAVLLDFFLGPWTATDVLADIGQQSESTAVIVLSGQNASQADEVAYGLAIDVFLCKDDLSAGSLDRAIRYAIRNRDQQVRLRNFSKFVSHDLLGPVGNLRNAAVLLKEAAKGQGADVDELVDVISEDCGKLISLLSGLREFAMSQDGNLNLATIPMRELVETALGNIGRLDALEDGSVVCDSLPDISVDPILFVHVIQNLIENGFKYNQSVSPRVIIRGEAGDGNCCLALSDNGIGIDPNMAKRVFQPMVRLHRNEDYEGSGLGLAICKEIVERHGGVLWVESTGVPGEGCTFRIQLPHSLESRAEAATTDSTLRT